MYDMWQFKFKYIISLKIHMYPRAMRRDVVVHLNFINCCCVVHLCERFFTTVFIFFE